MIDGITNLYAKPKGDDCTNNEKANAEYDISDWPSVIQCPYDQYELSDNINSYADDMQDKCEDGNCDRIAAIESRYRFERSDVNKERECA